MLKTMLHNIRTGIWGELSDAWQHDCQIWRDNWWEKYKAKHEAEWEAERALDKDNLPFMDWCAKNMFIPESVNKQINELVGNDTDDIPKKSELWLKAYGGSLAALSVMQYICNIRSTGFILWAEDERKAEVAILKFFGVKKYAEYDDIKESEVADLKEYANLESDLPIFINEEILKTAFEMVQGESDLCRELKVDIAHMNSCIREKTIYDTMIEKSVLEFHQECINPSVRKNDWGEQGEKEVDYILKWLPKEYVKIEKNCLDKKGRPCIILKNSEFIDESQEYDHIVIGVQGIFLIETKHYSGKIRIDEYGNWFRMKKGDTEWKACENPIQQIGRHHVLLESIVGKDLPIVDVICLSHPEVDITGQANCRVPIIRKDALGDYIQGYKSKTEELSLKEIAQIVKQIDGHKICCE